MVVEPSHFRFSFFSCFGVNTVTVLPPTPYLGVLFARTEGIIPAPESAHAIAQAIREAKRAKEEGVSKTILFNLSGHGQIDLYAYEQYFAGKLRDYEISDDEIRSTLNELEKII